MQLLSDIAVFFSRVPSMILAMLCASGLILVGLSAAFLYLRPGVTKFENRTDTSSGRPQDKWVFWFFHPELTNFARDKGLAPLLMMSRVIFLVPLAAFFGFFIWRR